MKKVLLLGVLLVGFLSQGQRTCGTPQKVQELMSANPNFAALQANVRERLQNLSNQTMATGSVQQPSIVVTVPVVVHVLYKAEDNEEQNISDAQIASQLVVLNNDFRKLNSDFTTVVPAVFQPLGADLEINFVMATIDPNGNATTGITRKLVGPTFNFENSYYLPSGRPAWDTNEYLNIWVGKFTDDELLGFAYPPGAAGLPNDGLCIGYTYFGTVGTATAPFNKGRTATHEIGHYFGLEHPWGADFSTCGSGSNSDGVADTPATDGPYYFCPNFPSNLNACTVSTNGSMFMNYMDYVNDACMAFFTNGQKLITASVIENERASVLLGTSDRVTSASVKVYPNPVSSEFTVTSSNQELTRVELFNIAGQLVKSQTLSGTEAKIDIRDFESGMYFARFYNGTKLLKSEKLIKQ